MEAAEQMLAERQKEEEQTLRDNFPIRSKIPAWMSRKLAARKVPYLKNISKLVAIVPFLFLVLRAFCLFSNCPVTILIKD